mmetsp:Transcript_36314/g.67072  ORF Transcript_36314/g.67072 Transcript_36314/m.67072 type:complete len:230 (+) Transcript_36314:764-1453(+)
MNIHPSMIKFATQNDVEPHLIPKGLGKAPPPFIRLMNRTTMNMVTRTIMFIMGASRSSSRISFSSSSIPSSSRLTSSPPSSSLPRSSSSSRWSLASASSSSSSSCAIRTSSLSFVPSARIPISSLMCRLSAAYILNAFLRVLYAVNDSRATSITTRNVSGRTLFRNAPISAPAMVKGSITRMRSQSTRGLSARGWRFLVFRYVFASAPPNTVMFDRGMACFGENPMTRM